MAADQGPVVQSALLRSDLIRLRKDRDLTQQMVADALEWSPSKLIRVEGGRSSITKTDLDALLNLYGVTSERQREDLQALNRGARETGWWSQFRETASSGYLSYVGYEAGAASIRQFHGTAVPGLLQTREYATALTSRSADPIDVRPAVELRMKRQAELAKRRRPPREHYVIDEAVIRRHVGISKDPAIMPDQLRRIVEVVEATERVTVQVIPFSAGAHVGVSGPFTLLEFDGDLSDVLYLEWRRTESTLVTGEDPRIAQCADDFESLLDDALSREDSLALIKQAAEEMS